MSLAVFSIHDVAPATLAPCCRLVELVEGIGARAALLVVPGPWHEPAADADPVFATWLRDAEHRGHEVVVHGWEHRAVGDPEGRVGVVRRVGDRALTRGCAEFAALGREEAFRRAAAGLRVLRLLGTRPVGFTPPGWLASPAALEGLRDVGFAYTTSRTAVIELPSGRRHEIPAYCQRPASPLARPSARLVESIVANRAVLRRSVRVALHPGDVGERRLLTSTERMIAAVGASRLEVLTYGELVESGRLAARRI